MDGSSTDCLVLNDYSEKAHTPRQSRIARDPAGPEQLAGKEVLLFEDNQATIKVILKGFSPKLRHVARHHKINLGSVYEIVEQPEVEISYVRSEHQAADIFTKELAPMKWNNALSLFNVVAPGEGGLASLPPEDLDFLLGATKASSYSVAS